jgi:membrane protein
MTHEDESCKDALGRDAVAPVEIPAQGWKQIVRRIVRSVYEDNLIVIAAGLGFFALLSIFPLLIAIVSIYGLVADPNAVSAQFMQISGILPPDLRVILEERLQEIVAASSQQLGLGAVLSILAALWASSKVITYLFMSLNVAYGERETRSLIELKATALLFTFGFVVFVVLSIGLVAVVPAVANLFGVGGLAESALQVGRWPLLAASIVIALASLYRFGPNRRDAKWQWITPGASVATIAWLGLSAVFSLYVSNFGKVNEIYGSLGSMIVVMLWFFLTCFLILLGAEINAKTEHQTVRDSTVGDDRPMGQRGAFVADTTPQEV